MTVRQMLDRMNYRSGDHDTDVRNALTELLQLREAREELRRSLKTPSAYEPVQR